MEIAAVGLPVGRKETKKQDTRAGTGKLLLLAFMKFYWNSATIIYLLSLAILGPQWQSWDHVAQKDQVPQLFTQIC